MPGHWGGSSGGGGPAGGASSGGNYGGGGGGHHGGGGGGGPAAQQAAAQRAMQQQIAQAEAQATAQRAEADRQQRVAQQAAAQKAAIQKAAETQRKGLGETLFPEGNLQNIIATSPTQKDYNIRATEDLVKNLPGGIVRDLLAPAGAGLMSLPYDAIQAATRTTEDDVNRAIDTAGMYGPKDMMAEAYGLAYDRENPLSSAYERMVGAAGPLAERLGNVNLMGTAQAATPGYKNIFQTGAVSQTPGGAYQPPAPAGTGEGLGSIAGPIQGLINQPKIAGPIQGLINQPKAAPVINPFEQPGARKAIPRPPVRSRIQDDRAEDIRKRALGNIALQTDKSLMDVSDPSRQGIMSGLSDTGTKEGLMSAGKNYAKKAAINYALQKTGLGFINPLMGLASLFGFKMPKGTGTKTAWTGPSEEDLRGGNQGQAPANVIEASIKKFSPEDANKIRNAYSQLQGVIDSGVYQGRQLTAEEIQMLQQKSLDIQKLMEQYLINPDELGLARGGIARLYG